MYRERNRPGVRGRGRLQFDDLQNAGRLVRQHHGAVGELKRLVNIVGHEHNGLTGLEPDALHFGSHAPAHIGIKRGKWFVHQHDLGINGECTSDRHPLTPPPDTWKGFAGLAGELDETGGARWPEPPPLLSPEPNRELGAEQHIVERGAPWHQPWRLEHECNLRPCFTGVAAIDDDAARADIEQSAHHPQRGRLAAAGTDRG